MKEIILAAFLGVIVTLSGCDERESTSRRERDAGQDRVIFPVARFRLVMDSSEGAYVRDSGHWYYIVSKLNKSTIAIGTIDDSGLVELSKDTTSESDTELPVKSDGEYDLMRLVRSSSGSCFLETRSRSSAGKPNETFLESRDEVQFIEGNWEDYEADRNVKFRLSSAGLASSRESITKLATQLFTRMFSSECLPVLHTVATEFLSERGEAIESDDLKRLFHVETAIAEYNAPNTTYTAINGRLSYAESRPATIDVVISVKIISQFIPQPNSGEDGIVAEELVARIQERFVEELQATAFAAEFQRIMEKAAIERLQKAVDNALGKKLPPD